MSRLHPAEGSRLLAVSPWAAVAGRPALSKLLTPILLALSIVAMGCDDPCAKLQKKVCEDPVYLKANKRHCELLNESARRDALPADFCTSILDSLAKR